MAMLAAVLVVLVGAGAVWQAVAVARDRERFPPPGELVPVAGGMLHVHVAGEQHDGPTILLEAGATSYSGQWHWLQQRLSESFRVVSYDRPGLGWSTPFDGPHDAAAVSSRLAEALTKLNIGGPFILVAHSYGSFIARVFAAEHLDEIAAVALLDATHPDQFGGQAIGAGVFGIAPALARVGLLRVMDPSGPATIGLPEATRQEARAMFASPDHLAAVAAEAGVWHISARQAAEVSRSLADIPMLIVSATSMSAQLPAWADHQADLAQLSRRAEHLTFDSPVTHESIVTSQDTAGAVAQAIAELAEAAASGELRSTP